MTERRIDTLNHPIVNEALCCESVGMEHETFGDRLYRLRTEQRLSRDALARETGITPSQLYNLEKRDVMPNPDTLDLLCQALAVSKQYLLYGVVAPPGSGDDWPPLSDILRVTTQLRREDIERVTRIIRDWERDGNRPSDVMPDPSAN